MASGSRRETRRKTLVGGTKVGKVIEVGVWRWYVGLGRREVGQNLLSSGNNVRSK